ncbi:MAG: T9SS type A sorting domain-containing protein [Phycisphaerae bacterium]|nr:T9SS type A sorting domain-containing protein [Saprospiraceae bacterium]
MKQTLTLFAICFLTFPLVSQVNFTANNQVVPYSGKFRPGINQGYYPGWDNKTLANLSAGNPAVNQKGIGAKANRQGLYEEVLGIFGYNLNVTDFQHYNALGMGEHVAIVGGPLAWHKDFSQASYCNNPASPNFGVPSNMFGNLYTPIWDGGANGTPYNDNNFFAAYLYQVVSKYKDDVRFWEIWNEPGLDLTGNLGWRDQNYPGNWWLEGPSPCDNILQAPIYNYIRTLRISWEIIKTVDPDSYVCLGSVGYQSFLNALLRNTDNPNNGDISAAYPLTGGAYFDCITYHSYPHFDGSTTNFNLQYFERHSDEAADGVVKYREYYQQILDEYGYDGRTFPEKEWIITEINSPRKVFGEAFPGSGTGPFFGGADAQINHMMKALMVAKVNKVHQAHTYQLGDQKNEVDANYEFHLMGLYKNFSAAQPYNVVVNDEGIALKTLTDLVWNTEYDAIRTAAMNLPPAARGYAFRRADGSYIYAIWARTTEDLSENAFANYSFPAGFNMQIVTKYNWDFGYTNSSATIAAQNIQLNARPVFFVAANEAPIPSGYCISTSAFPWHDWIAGVQVGTINNLSGKTVYSNYTGQSTNMAAGFLIPITLTAGFSWATYNENWSVWIDFNKNATFEASEKVFEGVQNAPAQGTPSAIFNGTLAIPANAPKGSTRMRISMKRGAFADPCEQIPSGEVEDYTVNITAGVGGNNPPYENAVPELLNHAASKQSDGFAIFPNPAQQFAMVNLKSYAGKAGALMIFNAQGGIVRTVKIAPDSPQLLEVDLAGLNEGYYLVQLRSEGDEPTVQKLMILGR